MEAQMAAQAEANGGAPNGAKANENTETPITDESNVSTIN